jgi:hypothetical protein
MSVDALPDRDLTPLERAIQTFNAGGDPTAGALQRAFLAAEVSALSPSEPSDGAGPKLLALVGDDGENYLQVFTHDDRIDPEVGRRYPWMIKTTGEKLVAFATAGITINPGSDLSLAVAVKPGGVEEMRELARARQAADEARAARAPHEIETAIAAVDRNGMDLQGILRFGVVLWPASLIVPSVRPLEREIDLDACFSFGPDDAPLIAAFTDRDQLGDFAASHLLEITGGELFHRLPEGVGIFLNPQRGAQLPMTGQGLSVIASVIERSAPPT